MIGALWTGISGLAAQQKALDNESHNIANVNTIGYKSSRISFADQMYQDKIGKGAKVLDAEKLYVQGNLKTTGVDYDMALSGHGFFAVSSKSSTGTSETFYTRAGNFRMGDNGTLQDAAGNEVQGWAMNTLTSDDILSTNPNINVFTSAYTELLTSKIVSLSQSVETYTAKATNYEQTSKSDVKDVYSGYGLKNQASKINDVKALVANYSDALSAYQDNPDGTSQSAQAQISQINFIGTDLTKEGDQIYVYIDGKKYSQNYISQPSRLADDGVTTLTDVQASQIATYKALADQISSITGMVAYTVTDKDITGNTETGSAINSFESFDTFTKSTKDADVLLGMIQIQSMIPGQEFKITEVAEVSGTTVVYGSVNETTSATIAQVGIGLGGLESARDALAMAITGNQRDVFTIEELNLNGADSYTFDFSVYDKDLQRTINFGSAITINPTTDIDTIITNLTTNATGSTNISVDNFNKYFTAKNINGNLVIEAKEYDVEFSSELFANAQTYTATGSAGSYTFDGTAALLANGQTNFTITVPSITLSDGTVLSAITTTGGTISSPRDLDTLAGKINDIFSKNTATNASGVTVSMPYTALVVNGELIIQQTSGAGVTYPTTLSISKVAGGIDKNATASGRKGAGAEFLEIKTTLDQTSSQDSLQLRLDTLGISDSAFGEFSVNAAGLITMKQDGAEFAIGQVAIALFNNERGLEPKGNNLLAKTTQSGEPTYNINNDRTATIESKTLELSTADLSESLVNLMVFQRAFEANAKSITTSDQLLTTLIGLKR
ncbi:flagellar hook-basal body complex protein [Arcobacter sp.]|uniref:flagellar hook-basal body complex protein n=1 Tax=Arcobacter sp. TaxID=1872629 RepID=UPI003D0B7A01